MMALNYSAIPEELKWDQSWCLAGPDDKGYYKAPYGFNSRGIFNIDPTSSKHWKDFETVLEAAEHLAPCGLGYILTRVCGYTCIDLDVKNAHNYPDNPELWTSETDLARFQSIINHFDSYTERSTSGQGFHIWIKGYIHGGKGLKRDGVEVYSQERFIVCTGDVYLDRGIEKRQDLLNILVAEIQEAQSNTVELVELEPTETDPVIFERARLATNSDKYLWLCGGNWQGEYPSQSEADFALLSIFAFYTKSNEQVRRMFRATELGKRPKTNKSNYHIDKALVCIRSRQAAEEEIDKLAMVSTAALMARLLGTVQPQAPVPPTAPANAPNSDDFQYDAVPNTIQHIETPLELDPDDFDYEQNSTPNTIAYPPGLVGAIAEWIFKSAPRPVREVAIVAALGFMAGLCGKGYTIPQSGLNLYIVLVARSAIGKESMHSGVSNLVGYLLSGCPQIINYVDFNDYASGPALSKAVAANPSFVNVSGEWGRKLKRLSQEDAKDGPMQQLRTVMTNLYQKSGPNSIVGGIGYSDKEKNVTSVSGAAYSMIGETTPNTFYDALTENMMEDGFLSRFTVVEYTGERPAANHNPVCPPHPSILLTLTEIATQLGKVNETSSFMTVERSPSAAAMLKEFDLECDTQVNKSRDEGWRQMWNRAHLKVCRIAALLCVGDNHVLPVIQDYHVVWALDLIRRDITVMQRRISSGDVGNGDLPREKKILDCLKKYITHPVPASYQIPIKMVADGVVPRRYIQNFVAKSASFTGHRLGANMALDSTIKSMLDSGYIVEVSKEKLATQYNFYGRSFRIVTIPMDAEERKQVKSNLN